MTPPASGHQSPDIASPAYARLVETIARGAFALIGAGTSVSLGYPAWGSLLAQLGDLAERAAPADSKVRIAHASTDFLVRATMYHRVLGADLTAVVAKIYRSPAPKPLGALHKDMVRIPFEHVLTTNYESVVEEAHQAAFGGEPPPHFDLDEMGPRAAFVRRIGQRDLPRHVIHLHGSAARPDHIILSLGEYGQRYTLTNDAKAMLQTMLAVRPLVFIGFSLNDEHFMHVLGELQAYFGLAQPTHFAIVPSPGMDKEDPRTLDLETRYGVTPLFYDPADGHAALAPLLAKLAADTLRRRQEIETEIIGPSVQRAVKGVFAGRDVPLSAEEAMEQLPGAVGRELAMVSTISVVSVSGSENADARTPLDDQIDEYFAYVRNGQPAAALALYDAALKRESGRLTNRLQFRLHANRGNAFNAMGDFAKASEAYLTARSFCSSKDARALEVLAHVLRKDYLTAWPLADALCKEFPDFSRAHSLRLQALPRGTSLRSVFRGISRTMRRDAEVANALGGIAHDSGDWRAYESYARAAVKASPEWAEGWVQLGTALLQRERARATIDADRGLLLPQNAERARQAEAAFDQALNIIQGAALPGFRSTALFNRAAVRRMLGNESGAAEDIMAAYAVAPDRHEVVAKLAWLKERAGDKEGALRLLASFTAARDHPDTCFIWALTLRERASGSDLVEAAQLLEPWLKRFGELADVTSPAEVVRLLSEIYCASGNATRALEIYESLPSDALPPGVREANLARLIFSANDAQAVQRAQSLIQTAVRASSGGGDWYTVREIAFAAAQVRDFEAACELMMTIVPTTRLSNDGRTLLDWAHEGELDSITFKFGKALRANGVFDRRAVGQEIDALIRYRDPQTAIALMQQWLEKFPDDRMMRLNLSLVGVLQRTPSLVECDPTKLPTVAEVKSPEVGANLIAVLKHGAGRSVALKAVYQLWRRFSESSVAQQLLILSVLSTRNPETALVHPARVDVTSAATVALDDGSTRLVVVEEGPDPRPTLDEFAPDHAIGQSVINRGKGDRVTLGFKHGTIRSIQNKIVYRAQACLAAFETTFPDGTIRGFQVGDVKTVGNNPKAVLGEMWNVLKADEDRRNYLLGLYREASLPLSMLAHGLGRSVFETVLHLAGREEVGIEVAEGVEAEIQAARTILNETTALVLDSSAVATMVFLGLESRLKDLPFKCVVPESVIQELHDLLRRRESLDEPAAFIGTHDDRLVMDEYSPEQQVAWANKVEGVIQSLRGQCEVAGGTATLKLPKELLAAADRIGHSVMDAAGIAKARGIPMWTDDLRIAQMLCGPLGVSRVWTQPVLESSVGRGFDRPAIDTSVTRLAVSGYRFTRMSVAMILDALAAEKWNVKGPITTLLLRYIGAVGAMSVDNCKTTRLLLAGIWRRCRSEARASDLINSILDQVERTVAVALIAKPLYRPSTSIYPTGDAKWRRFRRVLRRWRVKCPSQHPRAHEP